MFLTFNTGTSTPTSQNGTLKAKGIVVFSGGSAANNLVDVFKTVRENKKCPLSYVIPISDNGGSSSELIRVFGGPGAYIILSINKSKTDFRQALETSEVRKLPAHVILPSANRSKVASFVLFLMTRTAMKAKRLQSRHSLIIDCLKKAQQLDMNGFK